MENKKVDAQAFIKNYLDVYKANGGKKSEQDLLDRVVGNNGYQLGVTYTLTGAIVVKTSKINGVAQTAIVLPTEEGAELSLANLMSVSSLKGYDLSGNDLTIEYYDVADKKQTTLKTRTTRTELVPEFNFEDVWQPPTRNFLTLAGQIADGTYDVTGNKVTFLGTACKPFKAKSAGEMGTETWKAENSRVIESKLWSLKQQI